MTTSWTGDLPYEDYPDAVRLLVRAWARTEADMQAGAASEGHLIIRPADLRAERERDLPQIFADLDLTHHHTFRHGLLDEFMGAYNDAFEHFRKEYNVRADDGIYCR